MQDSDKDALIKAVNDERAKLLGDLDSTIAAIQKVKSAFTAMKTGLEAQRAAMQAKIPGTTDPDAKLLRETIVGWETIAIGICQKGIEYSDLEIQALQTIRGRINDAFDRIIGKIKETTFDDGDTEYSTDDEPVYVDAPTEFDWADGTPLYA